jgi:hypothetical protein
MFEILAQTTTPNTDSYMIAGYVVFFVVMILYLGSLLLRHRNLVQDYEVLQELEKDSEEK